MIQTEVVANRNSPYSVTLTHTDGHPRVVLAGEIDQAAVPEFFQCLQDADRLGTPVVVDLHEATFIDSAGIGVIGRLAAAGVELHIVGATGVVARALEITGVQTFPGVTLA